jgi:hypothetical protein
MEHCGLTPWAPILKELPNAEVRRDVQQLDLMKKVVRPLVQVDTMDLYTASLAFLVRGGWRLLRDDMNFDSLGLELL